MAASDLRDTTFASISHELRTPLNGIVGLADALLADSPSERTEKMLSVIKAQGLRLTTLVDDILDAAMSRRQKLIIKHEQCDLHHLADEVDGLLRPLIRGEKVTLVNAISEQFPSIEGDRNRLTQILTNLVRMCWCAALCQ